MIRQTVFGRKLEPVNLTGGEILTSRGYAATLLHGGPSQKLNRSTNFKSENILSLSTSRQIKRATTRPSDVIGNAGSRVKSLEDAVTPLSNSSRTVRATEAQEMALESEEYFLVTVLLNSSTPQLLGQLFLRCRFCQQLSVLRQLSRLLW